MKAILILIAAAVTNGSTLAQTKQVVGTAGYLSEWEMSGTVAIQLTDDDHGDAPIIPIIWKHVGLCSANGPEEREGQMTLRIHKSWMTSKIEARLSFDGEECRFSRDVADKMSGLMDCSNAKGIPLTLSFK